MRQRAVAGAEIVESERDALIFEACDDRAHQRQILEQRAFGDLDLELRGGEARFDEQLGQLLAEPGILELLRRDIDHEHDRRIRSEEHTSELQSLMRISYAVFCLQKKKRPKNK